MVKWFAWDGAAVIAEYEDISSVLKWKKSYVYLGGRLLATQTPTITQYHHPDRLGTRLVTNAATSQSAGEQENLPFGTALDSGISGNTRRFTSYDRSDMTKLDYAVNRFYNPGQGRFTQVDPMEMDAASLGDPQTLNLYSYCGNDPINCVDPEGLFWGAIGSFFKAIGKAILRLFSSGGGASSGPGFRTPPTFPGSLPGTGIGSSGGPGGFRTPPFNPGASSFLPQEGWTDKLFIFLFGRDEYDKIIAAEKRRKLRHRIAAIIAHGRLCAWMKGDCEQLTKLSDSQILDLYFAVVDAVVNGEKSVTTDGVTINIAPAQPGAAGPTNPIKEVFESIEKSGKVPQGWKALRGSTTKVNINDKGLLDSLRKVLPGQWKKVYKKGIDGSEIHYFEHASGKVFNVKHVVK